MSITRWRHYIIPEDYKVYYPPRTVQLVTEEFGVESRWFEKAIEYAKRKQPDGAVNFKLRINSFHEWY